MGQLPGSVPPSPASRASGQWRNLMRPSRMPDVPECSACAHAHACARMQLQRSAARAVRMPVSTSRSACLARASLARARAHAGTLVRSSHTASTNRSMAKSSPPPPSTRSRSPHTGEEEPALPYATTGGALLQGASVCAPRSSAPYVHGRAQRGRALTRTARAWLRTCQRVLAEQHWLAG